MLKIQKNRKNKNRLLLGPQPHHQETRIINISMYYLVIFLLCETFFKNNWRASLVAQWLRICLPMQGTRVRALVWEDPTCRGATGPVSHNY